MAKKRVAESKQKYAWAMSGNYVYCYKSDFGGQDVAKLWEVAELSEFHDADLAKATNEINTILSRLEKKNRSADRKLSFVAFENRHLLVWARYGVVGPFDDRATIIKAFKLKTK